MLITLRLPDPTGSGSLGVTNQGLHNTTLDMSDTTQSPIQIIHRDHLPPLRFRGVELASTDDRDPSQSTRWTRWTLYRTDAGRYVLSIRYRTQWEHERSTWSAVHADTREEFIRNVQVYYWASDDSDDRGRVPEELSSMLSETLPETYVMDLA